MSDELFITGSLTVSNKDGRIVKMSADDICDLINLNYLRYIDKEKHNKLSKEISLSGSSPFTVLEEGGVPLTYFTESEIRENHKKMKTFRITINDNNINKMETVGKKENITRSKDVLENLIKTFFLKRGYYLNGFFDIISENFDDYSFRVNNNRVSDKVFQQ